MALTIKVQGPDVTVFEEFVYLGSLIHSTTGSTCDISRRSAITRAAMQSLENQIWRSRLAISTKLKLYNTILCSPKQQIWLKTDLAYPPCSPKLVPLSSANSSRALGMLPHLQLSPIWEQEALAVQQGERQNDVDVWCYAIVSCMPETTTTLLVARPSFTLWTLLYA